MTPETEIKILKLEKTILELDIKWDDTEKNFLIHTRSGSTLPSIKMSNLQMGILIFLIMTVIVCYFLFKIELFKAGMYITGLSGVLLILKSQRDRAVVFEKLRNKYINQKQELQQELKTLKNEA